MDGANCSSLLRCALYTLLCLAASCDKPKAQPIERRADQTKKFDLVCVGRWFLNGETEKPFRDRFRVDIEQGTWCRESCQRIYKISVAEPGKLQLSSADADGQGNSLSIDRVSGELYGQVNMDTLDSTTIASCQIAPFSGFPATKF